MLCSPYTSLGKAFSLLPISPSATSPAFSTQSDFTIAGKLLRCYVYQVTHAPVLIEYTLLNYDQILGQKLKSAGEYGGQSLYLTDMSTQGYDFDHYLLQIFLQMNSYQPATTTGTPG